MRRVRFVLCISFLIVFIIGLNCLVAADPQYYNYSVGGSANSFPFNIAAGKEVQLLYLPGDFNQPTAAPTGSITKVSFFIHESYPLGPWTYTDLTIKMGQSAITSFDAGTFYTGSLTTVYSKASVSLAGTAGQWMTIPLDTPFPYDPTQSLIIDVAQSGAEGAAGFSMSFTSLTGNRRNWSSGGAPFIYNGQNATAYHMGITLTESNAPVATTSGGTALTPSSARLNGVVNAKNVSTSVSFEYGPTAAYGTTVAGVPSTVSGATDVSVHADISGLTPGTTYHYRVVAVSSEGTTYGSDATFAQPVSIPTLSEWGMILFAALLGIASLYFMNRRRFAS
jgi:hypothetical protein